MRLDYIASELGTSAESVEHLCGLLILDGSLAGWLDQVTGVLHLGQEHGETSAEARKFSGIPQWVKKLETIRTNLNGKVSALTE